MLPFDDRDGWIWYDGDFVPWREAKFHVLTHSLHYGGGVFEGERAYDGEVFKLTKHSQRLIDSARMVGYDLPYSAAEIDQATIDTLKKNNLKDAYVRPIAWRGADEMGLGARKCKAHVAIAVWDWPSVFPKELREKGLKLKTSGWRRPAPDTAPSHSKVSGLYMICTMSKHQAEDAGYDDALMLDYRGQVAEATGANIFVIKDGKIETPIPDCFLNGITRQTVMDIAKEKGYEVTETVIMPEDLEEADEIFVTGTAYEIMPVGKIDDQTYEVGPITKDLRKTYETLVRQK